MSAASKSNLKFSNLLLKKKIDEVVKEETDLEQANDKELIGFIKY